jgi:predicted CxxxxCH...CXXCH cytochrome family protein
MACGSCHPGYTSTSVVAATHVDGVVDATGGGSCTSCHGDSSRAGPSSSAPPRDTAGNTATTAPGVGAHQVHLAGGPLRAGISCTECHPVPAAVATGVHPNGVLELAFGPLASAGTTAAWNATTLTCAVYCHGVTLGGGTVTAPVWTTVNGTQAACGTCHGVPPPLPHVQLANCGGCHPGATSTTVDPTTHVDGTVQTVTLACTSCHGDAARALVAGADPRAQAAPPSDSTGATATTLVTVGAHLSHLNPGAGAIAAPLACSECHVVPASNSHADGAVTVTFGARSRTGGVSPAWNPGTATCSTVYCHGATLTGGTLSTPVWTTVNGTQKACNACHGNPPSTGQQTVSDHRQAGCGACHPGYGATTANLATHVDGLKEVGNKLTAYTASTRTCTNSCHGNKGTW